MYSSISTHRSTTLLSSVNSNGILHSLSLESFTLVKIDASVGMKFCIRVKGGELVAHWTDLLIIGRSLDDSAARDTLNSLEQTWRGVTRMLPGVPEDASVGLGAIHLLPLHPRIESCIMKVCFFWGPTISWFSTCKGSKSFI